MGYTTTKKTVYGNCIFLIAVMTAAVLTSIPAACAVLTVEPVDHAGDVLADNQSFVSSDEPCFSSSELLVKVKHSSKSTMNKIPTPEDTGIDSLNKLNKKYGVSQFEQVAKHSTKKETPLANWYKVTLKHQKKAITKQSDEFGRYNVIMNSYKSDPNIECAEPDYVLTILSTPDDPYYTSNGSWGQSYADLWGMKRINSESAWDSTTGSPAIIVADIDTGVDRNHKDLRDNTWVNTAEIPNNGIDEDKNGYVDDYYGWDWVNDDNDPMDDHGHGTHTAGTIAAVGNNSVGVVGVNWNCELMALKFLNSGGSGYVSDAAEALQYAADMGARVSSNSWGAVGSSQLLDDAVRYAHDQGMVVIAAAGNSNADALDFTPASADQAITVAATDYNDKKASFSNGGQKVDVAAPGVDILSTRASTNNMCTEARGNIVGTSYCYVSGTSMATPHVAGLAALVLANNPSLTNEDVRQIIHTGAVDLGTQGKDRDFGFGRIDAYGSIALSDTQPLAPMITSPSSRMVVYGLGLQIMGSVPGPDFAQYKVEAGAGRDPAEWDTLTASISQVIDGTLATVDTTQLADGFHIFRLTATDTDGKSYQFQVHDIEVDNFDADITYPVTLISQANIDVLGSAQTKNALPFDHYTLDWGEGTSPATYSTSGIMLNNNGLQPVNSSILGTWDTSSLTPGQVYTIRLTVTASNGATSQCTTAVTLDEDLVKGWPKSISRSTSCLICEATPTIADLDNDGVNEVILTSPDNKIYVFRKDGTDFPGFPVSVTPGERFTWPANVNDLDNDGANEIIAASVSFSSYCSGCSKIYIIKSDGTFYPGWPNPVHGIAQEAGDGTPTIADLNGDGNNDLVVIDPYYKKMHAYQLDGSELAGFPKNLPFVKREYPGAPSIVDLDNNGTLEIAYGIGNTFYVFDNEGNVLSGWPFVAPTYNGYAINFHSSAATGDIDGDGILEVLAIAHNNGSCSSAVTPIYAWKKDGTLVPNWPMNAGNLCNSYSPLNSPSVTDIDNDGKDEAVIGLFTLSIFDQEGKKLIGNGIGADIAPAISDVDGDGKFEFSGVRYNRIQIGNDDGSIYWQRIFSTKTRFISPAVFADLDNNGKVELSVVQRRHPTEPGDLIAYLWELPETSINAANGWPMFLHDSQRSGRLALSGPADTTPPTTSITAPSNASTVSGTIEVRALASDNRDISRVELYRNSLHVDTKTSSPYTFIWNTTREENGLYTLQSKAYDSANNSGISPRITVNVSNGNDTTTPTVSITHPLNNSEVKRKSTVTITACASDTAANVEFYVNGHLECVDTTERHACDWKVPAKPRTTYLLHARAFDAEGNAGASAIVRVISM